MTDDAASEETAAIERYDEDHAEFVENPPRLESVVDAHKTVNAELWQIAKTVLISAVVLASFILLLLMAMGAWYAWQVVLA